MAAIGAAAASWAACLTLLACVSAGLRGRTVTWLLIAALVLGILAGSWRLIGRPYLPDDDRAYDLRGYALYAAAFAGAVAVGTWLFAKWRRRAADGSRS